MNNQSQLRQITQSGYDGIITHPDIALELAIEEATERYYKEIDEAFTQNCIELGAIALQKIQELEARLPETIELFPTPYINKEEFIYTCEFMGYSLDDAEETWHTLDVLSLDGAINIQFGTRHTQDGAFEPVKINYGSFKDRRTILNLASVKDFMRQNLLEKSIVMDTDNRKSFSILKRLSDWMIADEEDS
jgi:hypothetical protein